MDDSHESVCKDSSEKQWESCKKKLQYITFALFPISFSQHEHRIVNVRPGVHRRVERIDSSWIKQRMTEEIFDYNGDYWRRMKDVTFPTPIFSESLFDNKNEEDPYSNIPLVQPDQYTEAVVYNNTQIEYDKVYFPCLSRIYGVFYYSFYANTETLVNLIRATPQILMSL